MVLLVILKQVPIQLQLFRLQRRFAAKLQKCFADQETLPDFPTAWVNTDFHFWVNLSFKSGLLTNAIIHEVIQYMPVTKCYKLLQAFRF